MGCHRLFYVEELNRLQENEGVLLANNYADGIFTIFDEDEGLISTLVIKPFRGGVFFLFGKPLQS